MFAIVTIAGQQFKVTEGQQIYVHQLDAEEGAQMKFDQVLFVDKDGKASALRSWDTPKETK